jgi:hypothetical protein
MAMSIIKPTVLTDAMLVSSSIPETEYSLWNAATSYTVGQRVIRLTTHHVYENLIAGVNSGLPEANTTGTTPRWLDIGADNTWAMFDNKVGTVSTATTSLTVVTTPGSVSGIGLLGLVGKQCIVSMKNQTGGTVVYTKTVPLDGTIITSFYDWFFEDYVQLSDITLTDLPGQYTNPEITLSVTSTGSVGCGTYSFGKLYPLGSTQYGSTVGIISYSVKTYDTFGNITIVKRANSKRNSLKVMTAKADFNKIYKLLSGLDSVPCIYVGTTYDGYEPTIVYGFWKDFSIDVSYPAVHLVNLEIEGMT